MEAEISPRDELILEVVRAASQRISIKDFEIQCQLAPVSTGKSYYDRLRVAEQLIEDGVIEKLDNRLAIIAKNTPEWLKQGMRDGSRVAWEIFAVIDKKGKIGQKIDLELLATIGLDGEKAVLCQLKKKLSMSAVERIRHISLVDDSAGFDIYAPSVRQNDYACLLEVKTSSRPGNDFRFFISRNEARVASRNENWRLVAVRREPSGYQILGHLRYTHFSEILPVDSSTYSKWESASIVLPIDLILPGLP